MLKYVSYYTVNSCSCFYPCIFQYFIISGTKPDDLKIVLNDSAKSSVKIGSQNARSENKDM